VKSTMSGTVSSSTRRSSSGSTKVRNRSGAPANQAATASDQRGWPAAEAVASATDSGTAGRMPA
jgi:hypothetical protein